MRFEMMKGNEVIKVKKNIFEKIKSVFSKKDSSLNIKMICVADSKINLTECKGGYSHNEAKRFLSSMNCYRYKKHNDWRLPTVEELEWIRSNKNSMDFCFGNPIDDDIFVWSVWSSEKCGCFCGESYYKTVCFQNDSIYKTCENNNCGAIYVR